MSKNAKIVLAIVILIAIALIAWCYFGTNTANTAPVSAPVSEQQMNNQNQQLAVATDTPDQSLTTSPSDDSNTALNSDMSVISSQSAAMDQDSAAANQSAQ